MILILFIAVVNIIYGIFQLSELIRPYTELLFPDIKTIDEIQDFYSNNKKAIQELVDALNKLPYKEIEVHDWVILNDNTILADGKDVFVDDVFDNSQMILDFFEKEKIVYLYKNDNIIHIGTDTAKDYAQGIAWLGSEKNNVSSIENTDNIYYTKKLSEKFWVFEERD